MATEVGSWIQPTWDGHQYYGQSGQIINLFTNQSGVQYWHVDADGDGLKDYTLLANPNKAQPASNTHQGALNANVVNLADHGTDVFDLVVPVIIAVTATGLFLCFIKKLRKR
jgi:hypothetical protein